MSSPPDPPKSAPSPTSPVHFTPVNRNPSGGDRDAPGAGRLADISESGLTRGGRAKTKLTMKPVTRTAKKEPVDGMQATTVGCSLDVADSSQLHHREAEDVDEASDEAPDEA